MAAKLTFNDIENAELDPSKLSFTVSITNTVSSGTVNPSTDAVIGSLYINSSTGDLFRKISAGSLTASWQKISSVNSIIYQNRYRSITQTSSVTATDTTTPSIGDLVGTFGAGSWAASTVLNAAKSGLTGAAGTQNAGLVAGGTNLVGSQSTSTELFNGSAWTTSGNMNFSKSTAAFFGSQSSAGSAGGNNGAGALNVTELFNTSIWSIGPTLNVAKLSFSGFGSQSCSVVAGGGTGGSDSITTTELFNGSTWLVGNTLNTPRRALTAVGTQSAGFVAGGNTGAAVTNNTELFNGSTWSTSGVLSIGKSSMGSAGSQQSGLIVAGSTTTQTNVTELFNGSTWTTSGVLNAAKSALAAAGGQNAALAVGGNTGASADNTTALHSQSIYRKVHGKNIAEAKSLGILTGAATVLIQGTNTSTTYPINKYLILNRSINSAVTNYNNLSSISFASVLGTAPTMTYNLSTTTTLLSVIPGNIALITAGGGNPVSSNNAGAFVISRVVSPSSFEVQNSAGTSQNPGTGTIVFITSMLAVDNFNSQDIVVGKTDSNGFLTLSKPLTIGSFLKRLK